MIEFIGKFHPLFVHLPIGFFTLLGVFELLALRPNWKQLASANRVILLLTIPASLAINLNFLHPLLLWAVRGLSLYSMVLGIKA